jgi:hypothetical protein
LKVPDAEVHDDCKGRRESRATSAGAIRGHGPFTETKELIGGFAIYDVATLDEAKEWTRRFLDLHVKHFPGWDCEVEIRQMMD